MKGPRCAPRSVEEGGLLGATRLNPGGFGFQKKGSGSGQEGSRNIRVGW